ncbi:MAG: BMP family ABC transporter substrate-binding protein, partial [Actinomycetota bacterium]
RLVTVAEHDEWSRRRVHASEIVALDVDIVAMQRVIELFTAHRLASLDRDQVSGAPTVEVAHEALLHEWERLRTWIEDNRDDLLRHRVLASAANVWNDAGRDQDYVYTGGRLDEALAWAGTSAIKLTERERDFLDAGEARLVAEREAVDERERREERLQRSTRRRTWGLTAAIVALVAVVAGVLFVITRPEGPKVALVQDLDPEGGLQDLVEQGWNDAVRRFDFEGERVVPLLDPEEDMRDFADAGYELIISSLYDDGALVYDLAPEYPETRFVVFDSRDMGLPNVTAFHFVREDGAYLMGAAAALESDTGRIGFIGGRQRDTTETRRAAYAEGARSVNPDIVVESVYLGPFMHGDSAYLAYDLAKETAGEMYRSGIDVIHHSAGHFGGGAGISVAAAELQDELGRELWVIGSEISEQRGVSSEQSSRFLTSMWKRWDKAVEEAVRAHLTGELEPGLNELGLDSQSVDYSRDGGISEETLAALDRVRGQIVDGTVKPGAGNTAAPEWTREPVVVASGVFDGAACSFDIGPTTVERGDVVRIDLVNESDGYVGVIFGDSDDGIDVHDYWPVSTWIAPRSVGAVARRLFSGVSVAQCFTEDGRLEGLQFNAVFTTTCEGPAPASPEPTDVLEALAEAMTRRDPHAVCSLFDEHAVFVSPWGELEGRSLVAELVTPIDDDLWLQDVVITDIVVDGTEVIWSSENRGLFGGFDRVEGHRTIIEDGKIVYWVMGEMSEG